MKINQNNDIFVYRGETAAIDFKMSQRSDYYVPFLISSARVNPMVCITVGSTRRESKNIITKQLWLDLDDMLVPRFTQTVVTDLGIIDSVDDNALAAALVVLMEPGIMYQFRKKSEVDAGNPQLHFAYEVDDTAIIDDYDFTVILSIDETITLDMTNIEYVYQIELMDTEPMIEHLQNIFTTYPELINKLPNSFTNTELSITAHLTECINLVTKTFPTHWGHRITNPYTSPVAKVGNIQMLQPPRRFVVQSVVK